MTNPKYYQEIDDRMHHLHDQVTQDPSQYAHDFGGHHDGSHTEPYAYVPRTTPKVAGGKKNEDEEFVRHHTNDVRAHFLVLKTTFESVVKTEYTAEPAGGSKTRQTKQATTEELAIKSLSARAHHAAVILGQKISLRGYMEAYHQHEEIKKEYSSHKSVFEQTTVKTVEEQLKYIDDRLPTLRFHVQAYEAADWTRLRLYRLAHAVYEFRSQITSYSIASWKIEAKYTTQFETAFTELTTRCVEIYDRVSAISEECEYYEHVEELVELVCTKTIEIKKTFVQLECVIVKLEREAAFRQEELRYGISQAKFSIESAGVHVSQILKIAQSIQVQKKDWVAQLRTDFQYLQMGVQEVKHEIDCWAERQLCPPPNHCAEVSGRLYALTSQGLKQVSALSVKDNCCTSIASLTETIDQIQYEVTQWQEKASALQSDPEFRYELFDKFWWPIARIRLALCECENMTEPGEETNQLLAHYFHVQERLKASVAGINVDIDLPRHCAQQGTATTVSEGASLESPKPDWVVPAAGFAEQIHDVLVDSRALIKATKELVTGATQVQTQKIERALEIELSWFASDVAAQKVNLTQFNERTLRHWTNFNLATQTCLAMAHAEVVGAEQKERIPSSYERQKAKKIEEIEKQLAAYDIQMKKVLGVQMA